MRERGGARGVGGNRMSKRHTDRTRIRTEEGPKSLAAPPTAYMGQAIFLLPVAAKDESDSGFQSPPIFGDFLFPPPFFPFISVIFSCGHALLSEALSVRWSYFC